MNLWPEEPTLEEAFEPAVLGMDLRPVRKIYAQHPFLPDTPIFHDCELTRRMNLQEFLDLVTDESHRVVLTHLGRGHTPAGGKGRPPLLPLPPEPLVFLEQVEDVLEHGRLIVLYGADGAETGRAYLTRGGLVRLPPGGLPPRVRLTEPERSATRPSPELPR